MKISSKLHRPMKGAFLIGSVFASALTLGLAATPARAQIDNGTVPVVGTWSRGAHDTVAWVDLTRWSLVTETTGAPFASPPAADLPWIPVAGDWDGDGVDSVQMFHRQTWQVVPLEQDRVAVTGDPSPTPWIPVAGDWDGDGVDTLAVYDLRDDRLHGLEEGPGRIDGYVPAPNPVFPVAGDWDGDGIDTLSTLELEERSTESSAPAWAFLSGDWDGDGIDTDATLHLATGELVFPEIAPARSAAGVSSAATTDRGIAGIFEEYSACYTTIKNKITMKHIFKDPFGGCNVIVVTTWIERTCCLNSQQYYSCTSDFKSSGGSYGYSFC